MSSALDRFVSGQPDAPALVGAGGSVLTYVQLRAVVATIADRWLRVGIKPGQLVILDVPAGPEFVIAVLAGLEAGLLVAPLSHEWSSQMKAQRAHRLEPDAYVTGVALDLTIATTHALRVLPEGLLLWTSGTSGHPKEVVLSSAALAWNARTNARVLGLTASDRTLVLLDPSYCYTLIHQIFSLLVAGGSVAVGFEPKSLRAAGLGHVRRATVLVAVPTLWSWLVNAPGMIDGLGPRLLTLGGARARRALVGQSLLQLPRTEIVITYGLTEAGPRVSCGAGSSLMNRPAGWVGYPLPGVGVIADARGQLVVSSPSNRCGYMVEGKFIPNDEPVATGDLGEVLPDGTITLFGRLGRRISRGGFLVSPEAIEDVLTRQPGVRDALVMGAPHRTLGESIMAYVVLDRPRRRTKSDLLAACRTTLGAPWVPSDLEFVDRLPSSAARLKG